MIVPAAALGAGLLAGLGMVASGILGRGSRYWVTWISDKGGSRTITGKPFPSLEEAIPFQDNLAYKGTSSIIVVEKPNGYLDCKNPVRARKAWPKWRGLSYHSRFDANEQAFNRLDLVNRPAPAWAVQANEGPYYETQPHFLNPSSQMWKVKVPNRRSKLPYPTFFNGKTKDLVNY